VVFTVLPFWAVAAAAFGKRATLLLLLSCCFSFAPSLPLCDTSHF
jgi:heme/copper-type cytochrome/quinol oxidase subunit 4